MPQVLVNTKPPTDMDSFKGLWIWNASKSTIPQQSTSLGSLVLLGDEWPWMRGHFLDGIPTETMEDLQKENIYGLRRVPGQKRRFDSGI